jgi:tetratricopeptide (TPR) repeat protein
MGWSTADWMNRGGELLDSDPWLGQRLLAWGICQAPQHPVGYYNLGISLHQQGRIGAAIRAYQQCLQLPEPPLVQVRNNLGQDLLLAGRWPEGWEHYQHRFSRRPGNYPHFCRLFGAPQSGPFRKGQTLVLLGEQGLGDTLQFCRFGLELQAQGLRVILLSQSALVPLLRESTALERIEDILDGGAFDPGSVGWLPLLDVPGRLGCRPDSIAHDQGYLQANPERTRHWGKQLQRTPGRRLIALHWQGNPGHENSLYSRGRSMRFEHWLGLRGLEQVEFVSIQKGAGSEQLRRDAGLPWVAGQAAVQASMDFRDTAAVLANCDLLLSADSGVVHLAGAMGVPTWVALRHVPEWRWGLQGELTPWYRSLRLFRQPWDGDWTSVVDRMRQALIHPAGFKTASGATPRDSAAAQTQCH